MITSLTKTEEFHTVVGLFEQRVKMNPEGRALWSETRCMSYRELDIAANQLAHELVQRGVGLNDRVALSLERTDPLSMIALLAVLKAGAVYVPLDPEYPPARLDYMLKHADVALLLTQRSVSAFSGYSKRCNVDELAWSGQSETPPAVVRSLDRLCYILYTSGSTGQPKGVAMPHGPLANLIAWQMQRSGCGVGAVTVQFSPLSFDVSFQEIFATFCAGGTLALISDNDRLDPVRLMQFMQERNVERIFLPFVALNYLAEVAVSHGRLPASLKEVITAGEQLQVNRSVRTLFKQLPGSTLSNQYGPTEAHVVSEYLLSGDPEQWPALPPIGKAISNTRLLIVDKAGMEVPSGESGELIIEGAAVAQGYLNDPERTAERFSFDPPRYRTGDLARVLPDGNIEFLGRADSQVKVRGYRIELGEIEAALAELEGVSQAIVAVFGERLAAYVVPGERSPSVADLRSALRAQLPNYMIPSSFSIVDALPLTPSGKVDRRALPQPGGERPVLETEFVAPRSEREKQLATLWQELLELDRVGVKDSFFELGGTSILLLRFLARLQKEQGVDLPVVQLFQAPTIAALAARLEGKTKKAAPRRTRKSEGGAVAIVGWSGRFPGANDVETFWENLCAGRESMTWFEKEELHASVDPALSNDPDYVRARGIIEEADKFDAEFFGFTPREAELMDPQQRVMLEVGWNALENAGYDGANWDGLVGVYAGMGNSTYHQNHVLTHPEKVRNVGALNVMMGNEKDYIATRLAYKLNLKGPSVSIHTACSTSLVAVSHAYHALVSGQCDMALAGGISITTPQNSGYLYQEGGMFSPDGHCRPFDALAQGTTFNCGAAMIVVKRLEEAQADGDRIYAVIRGVGLNNDGGDKMSFTAPSVDGQAGAIQAAHACAGISPETISYVEAHGTATPVGDPIEVAALTQAFRAQTDEKQFCALGSVKGNVGHLICAAGVTGLIKTALALYHETLPGTLFFENPNPQLDLENSPFYVPSAVQAWPAGPQPRRAGVSSFGVGGTNAHVILEEAPAQPKKERTASRPKQLMLLSAKTSEALERSTERLAAHLATHPESRLNDAAFTLLKGRHPFGYRRCLVGGAPTDFQTRTPKNSATRKLTIEQPPVVFMFPGQGAQYVNMGRNLYDVEPIFRAVVDECAVILSSLMDCPLLELLYPAAGQEDAASVLLKQTHYTQPCLFVIQVALARLWMSWGVQPEVLTGHSVGEFAAAHIAGVMSLQDALTAVAERGRLMQALPSGAMLSVRAPFAQVESLLPAGVTAAAINAPNLCVLSGPHEAVTSAQQALETAGVEAKLLKTSHAFHSSMMDPMIEPFGKLLAGLQLAAPQIPIVSTVTGRLMSDAEAMDLSYWVQQIRKPVRFADAVQHLWERPERILLEVGPGQSCSAMARNSRRSEFSAAEQVTLSSLALSAEDDLEWQTLLLAVGQLWMNGVALDWEAFYAVDEPQRIPLPGYAFERKRHWVEPATIADVVEEEGADEEEEGADLSRRDWLVLKVRHVLEDISGEELSGADESVSFVEFGFDSLFLTQASLSISNQFKVKVTFRQLMENYTSVGLLADFLDEAAPADLQGASAGKATLKPSTEPFAADEPAPKKTFGAGARIATSDSGALNAAQHGHLDAFIRRYNQRTQRSREMTVQHRQHLADPRVVSGFRPLMKELVYPIVVDQSEGCRMTDVDGHEYVDLTCGFGSNFFGFSAPFIKEAVHAQLDRGYEIGPQHALTGEVAQKICAMTGLERAAFCNTGSEAVLGAMRLARTVTGRDLVVMFTGDYHGIIDEVIVRGTPSMRSLPAAPGIPRSAVENVLVLDYGEERSLQIIRERADEIAAIMVEPVQSRRPEFQPREFLHACRALATELSVAFIMDEVITGFRIHPRGAQGYFEVEADLATYGKVVGGGMPIGVIAGSRRFMDALDGGQWQFGDDSFPEVGVTYFAGTFVRHPLALAAAKASLDYMEQQGPALQQRMNERAEGLAERINEVAKELGVSLRVKHFGSLMKVKFAEDEALSDLFYAWMRYKGIHIWDNRPCFLTVAHSDDDIAFVEKCFRESMAELAEAELLQVEKPLFEMVDGRMKVPTTEPQKEIWVALLMDPEASKAYNESVSLRMKGALEKDKLHEAVQQVIARHDALRSTFTNDGMHMLIAPQMTFPMVEEGVDADRLKAILLEEVETPFDLEKGPLLRIRLLELSEEEHVLVLTGHHIVCDGWSIDVVVKDLGQIYTALTEGRSMQMEPAFSIAEYSKLELEWGKSEAFEAANRFWLDLYSGELPVLDLPTDRPRSPMRTSPGDRIDAQVDDALVPALRKICSQSGCTFVNLLMAAFAVYLRKLSGQTDVVVGLPTSGQAARGMDSLVGHCVNLLPIRSQVNDELPFVDYMKQLRSTMLDAFEHQLYTFGTLVRNLKMARDPSRVPLAPVVFNVDNGIDLEKMRYGALETKFTSNPRKNETFELFMNAVDEQGEIFTEWSYNTDLFDAATIRRFISEFDSLLERIAVEPDLCIRLLLDMD